MDKINCQQLRELTSPPVRFLAQDVGTAEVLAASCPAKRELELKVGAQVRPGVPLQRYMESRERVRCRRPAAPPEGKLELRVGAQVRRWW